MNRGASVIVTNLITVSEDRLQQLDEFTDGKAALTKNCREGAPS